MVGKPGRSGGARKGAGHPPGFPGGRTVGAIDIMPRERGPNGSSSSLTTRKWAYAEKALRHAERAIEVLVDVMEHGESDTARLSAADKILDRALGKAPSHVDVSALRHTEIVYRSAEEIRKELIERGAPPVLLDLTVDEEDDDDAADNADHA
jgi:hypothetical protein